MKRVIWKLAFLITGCILLCGCRTEKGYSVSASLSNVEEAREELGILYGDVILDLGNRKVAYIVEDSYITFVSDYDQHIVIKDAVGEKSLYIPCPSSNIKNVQIVDNTLIEIEFVEDNQVQKKIWQIPHNFWGNGDISFWHETLLLNSSGIDESAGNEKVWEKEIRINGSRHTLSWERISQVYCDWKSIYETKLADYSLTLFNEKGEVVCQQTVGGYPVCYEEVCWIKDISGDGNEDIIFCTFWYNSEWTELFFLEWTDQEKFQSSSYLNETMCRPQWNEKLQTLMFWVDSLYPYMNDMEMYQLQGGEWEPYAQLLIEVSEVIPRKLDEEVIEEIFYKELDTHKREIFYENGKIIQNEITDESWFEEESIWYGENPDNLKLFPGTGWEIEKVVLSTGEEVYKYLMEADEPVEPLKSLEPYIELLTNYDRVLHDPSYERGNGTGFGGFDENMVYDRVLRNVGKEPNEVVYAVVDLAEDGEPELLIGDYWSDGFYRPFIIYGNVKGKISPGTIAEEYLINLYEGGIIEVIAGKGMYEDFRYSQMKKNSVDTEEIVRLWADRLDGKSDEYIYYIYKGNETTEVTKEEFEAIRRELTSCPLEVNWKPLEGFWQEN